MAYLRNNLISRKSYSGFGSWTDTIGDIAKGAVSLFGAQQRQAGATDALQQQLAMQQAAQQQSTGISTTTIVAGAAVLGVAAFLLLRKKKAS